MMVDVDSTMWVEANSQRAQSSLITKREEGKPQVASLKDELGAGRAEEKRTCSRSWRNGPSPLGAPSVTPTKH